MNLVRRINLLFRIGRIPFFEKGYAASALMASHDVTLCIWWRYHNPDNALDASVLLAIYAGKARASCFQNAEVRMNIVVLRRGSGCCEFARQTSVLKTGIVTT